VERDLKRIKSYHRIIILERIQKQLSHQPNIETKNRKILKNLVPPFESAPPVWELRIGVYRIFYDIEEEEKKVYVRAIRRKPVHKTTEEIL
jgi:mRNA-degrading endonuclease RelE of RelBE toxin-antitoxin system